MKQQIRKAAKQNTTKQQIRRAAKQNTGEIWEDKLETRAHSLSMKKGVAKLHAADRTYIMQRKGKMKCTSADGYTDWRPKSTRF